MRCRSRLYAPLVRGLARLGVRPNQISHLRVLLLAGYWSCLKTALEWSVLFVILGLWLDSLDGPLARHLHAAGDTGKFVDSNADHVFYSIVLIGAIKAGLVGLVAGALHVVLTLLLNTYSMLDARMPSAQGWLVRPFAGPRVSLRAVVYACLLVDALCGTRCLAHAVWPANAAIGLLALGHYFSLAADAV